MTITANVEAAQIPWRPLGELFVSRGLISESELETALAEQAATGKRLGEILVERGLVSGPDLTSALMDQLGVEISKEEGFGSGLWAEIKRRHKRVRPDESEEEEPGDNQPGIALVEALAPEPAATRPAAPQRPAPELKAPEPAVLEPTVSEPEPGVVPPAAPEFEQELEKIKTEYQPPAPIEPVAAPPPKPEPEPEAEPEPEPLPAAEAEPEPEPEPRPEDSTALRAELEEARADLAHLQEMLADAMTALAALTAEAAGESLQG